MLGYTPMMEQYLHIKQSYRDAILFFRLGDFYEMFFDDALLASRELEITLTGRDAGEKERVPMCGVPYHAADNYIARLIKKGYKVAVCEQVEDPSAAKGIVKREVVRVITPGTVLEGQSLEEGNNNYLLAVAPCERGYGLAVADISTGLFQVTQIEGKSAGAALIDEIVRLTPSEILIPGNYVDHTLVDEIKSRIQTTITFIDRAEHTIQHVHKALEEITDPGQQRNLEKMPLAVTAAGVLLDYIKETQKKELSQVKNINIYSISDFMVLDTTTRRNLEITSSLRDGNRWGTLIWVLDNTCTAMGCRLLKNWLEQPLLNVEKINHRLQAVEEMVDNVFLRLEIVKFLKEIYDLERLVTRSVYGSANARDLLALKKSLSVLPEIKRVLDNAKADLLIKYKEQINPVKDIYNELERGLKDDPPVSLREGSLIREGYHPEVDSLRSASRDGRNWLAGLEARERERTGIKSLKIGFNKVFGYYLEVTKSNLGCVPKDFIRRQTLANAERFITPELKAVEERILGAEDRLIQLEYKLFCEIREKVAVYAKSILETARALAGLDVIISLAVSAIKENLVRPRIGNHGRIFIREGRHPVVEKVMGPGKFVPNDIELGGEQNLILLTGPNMAGKSTYMRQVALLVLMAQTGSFVPAAEAEIGLVDRIFTRVGAADDLAAGQSTFMVEMKECQVIVSEASNKSLIIMDEVGRGTSTYDGISIARALVEYIVQNIGAKTIFSTHYHELTDLEQLPGVKNYTILVKEEDNSIYFLRRVVPGRADRSYGIHVAALAGLPDEIIKKARYYLEGLECVTAAPEEIAAATEVKCVHAEPGIMINPKGEAVLQELATLDLLGTTPLEALNILARWQKKLQL